MFGKLSMKFRSDRKSRTVFIISLISFVISLFFLVYPVYTVNGLVEYLKNPNLNEAAVYRVQGSLEWWNNFVVISRPISILFLGVTSIELFMSSRQSTTVKIRKTNEWGESGSGSEKDPSSVTFFLSNTLASTRNKIGKLFAPKKAPRHIWGLRRFKRGVAGLLFFFYMVSFIYSISNPVSILFLLTGFLMLDYLWKTRHIEWIVKK